MYDLLIKGGRVIDPSQDIDGVLDVAIAGGKVATIAKDISAQEGRQVIDAGGRVVTPGLIELHCHVAGGIHVGSVDPDLAGVNQGVTTVVDGGSTGAKIFAAFPRYIIPSSRTRVFCFLHLSSLGLTIKPELRYDEIDLEATAAAIESYRGLIKGVKLMLVGPVMAREGTKLVAMAQKAAKRFGLPIMVHIGDEKKQVSPALTREMLPMLESGDIVSHIYTAQLGGLLGPDGRVFPELKEAMDRGVIMDTALGMNNFSFEVARKSIGQGILPTTLSSDLTPRNWKTRV
ncbi:MAG: amidohydrolase family protein, partial [Chloroflexi bacterium]|nr:amidohydrolase family protein [Chloroflexota bacterium]